MGVWNLVWTCYGVWKLYTTCLSLSSLLVCTGLTINCSQCIGKAVYEVQCSLSLSLSLSLYQSYEFTKAQFPSKMGGYKNYVLTIMTSQLTSSSQLIVLHPSGKVSHDVVICVMITRCQQTSTTSTTRTFIARCTLVERQLYSYYLRHSVIQLWHA